MEQTQMPRGAGGQPFAVRVAQLSELHADPANVRKHGDKNLKAIEDSLRAFGQVEPLVVQKSTGKVIGGNGRLEVMRRAGTTEAAIVELDIDDTRAAALAIALNRTAELAAWDETDLSRVFEALPKDLQGVTGFTESDIEAMAQAMELPDFEPVGIEDQSRLDQKAPTTCPECGHVWTP